MRSSRAWFAVCLLLCANALILVVLHQENANRLAHAVKPENTQQYELNLTNFFTSDLLQVLQQQRHKHIVVLEPHILSSALELDQVSSLRWRFELPSFAYAKNSLTLATFNGEAAIDGFAKVTTITGRLPYSNQSKTVLHRFLLWRNLKVHLVVLHKVRHFLWIGQISEKQLTKLDGFNVHFGKHEQIYDPFGLTSIDSINFPNDIYHLLSQMSSARFIQCPPESLTWLERNNVTVSEPKIASSVEAIVGMKSLMRKLRMQIWLACGTLLGWYRQCHITPYTSDTDFATWARYLNGLDMTESLRQLAPYHNLSLYLRFGEPVHSMEYSFYGAKLYEKIDLFWIYKNGSHFLLPYHMPSTSEFAYSIYPPYSLCSVDLLGHKLLAPCQPELVIQTEYGTDWREPMPDWNYAESPLNSGPSLPFQANVSQYEEFG